MKWTSTVYATTSLEKSLRQATSDIHAALGDTPADLGLLFVSSYFRQQIIDAWPHIQKELPIKQLIGCTAGGVIGGGNEVETEPAVSLTAASLPGVKISPFQIQQGKLPDADAAPKAWRQLVGAEVNDHPQFLLLADPFSLDVDALISGLDFAFPSSVKVGGLASGGAAAKENLLFLNEKIIHNGAIGATLSGDISVEVVVAQGCRPIGDWLSVTSCRDNILMGVNGQAPLNYLQELYEKLEPRDRHLLHHSLFLGVIMDPFNKEPKQGDFLIRNIIGLDQEQGLLAIGSMLRPGQTVQFHLRDATTSKDDLELMLSKSGSSKSKRTSTIASASMGAMLFSCLGRGEKLYGEPNHDSTLLKSMIGNIPVGGFFCNGEIGPVGGKTYLHGYTSSIAVFGPSKQTDTSGGHNGRHGS